MNIIQNVYFYIIYVHISATKFYVIFLNILVYSIDLYKLPNTKYNQTRHDIDNTVQIILLESMKA